VIRIKLVDLKDDPYDVWMKKWLNAGEYSFPVVKGSSQGPTGTTINLPPGIYTITLLAGPKTFIETLWLAEDKKHYPDKIVGDYEVKAEVNKKWQVILSDGNFKHK
jgi:hypothetical protein